MPLKQSMAAIAHLLALSIMTAGVGGNRPPAAYAAEAESAVETVSEEGMETAQGGESAEDAAGTAKQVSGFTYALETVKGVDGRQGIACENGEFWVSGNDTLSHYDENWNLLAVNTKALENFNSNTNHIGDIDVYQGEIYVCAENFASGASSDLQLAVFDAQTLEFKRTLEFKGESGQAECSGVAVDPDTQSLWLCSWVNDESSQYLYRYSLESGKYIGRVYMEDAPKAIQGIAYYNGYIYLSTDDGLYSLEKPDHIYRCRVDPDHFDTGQIVKTEMEMDTVLAKGEAEGLTFDRERKRLLVSHNRLKQDFLTGEYEEVREVYIYAMERNVIPPDYSDPNLWVARPDGAQQTADVFLVLPTANMDDRTADNTDITSHPEAARFREVFNIEKGLFDSNMAVYAPYYRQCTYGVDLLPEGEEKERYREIAKEDIKAAFGWYLDHCHQEGKPIVLFGFSQGAERVKELLVEFGQDERLAEDLAAAYVIGASITQEDVDTNPCLKMAKGEKDTGVIISYDCIDASAARPGTTVLSINPLNWTTNSTMASKQLNKGYVAVDPSGSISEIVLEFCGAYRDEKTGLLIVTGIKDASKYMASGLETVPDGSYHYYDLNFFYNNLKNNISKRTAVFINGRGIAKKDDVKGEQPF